METRYSVRLTGSDRHIKWCNDCWYETESTPNFQFTREGALKIAEKLKKHYQYKVTLVPEDPTVREEEINSIKPKRNPLEVRAEAWAEARNCDDEMML